MDLSFIQTHLDNFVDTWKGWGSIFEGITKLAGRGYGDAFRGLSSTLVSPFYVADFALSSN